MMKRFLILLTLLLAMLFSCDQPTDVGSNNGNQQTNENQNQGNQNGENTGTENNKDDVVTTGKIVGKATYTNTANHAGIQVTLVSTDGIVAYNSQISSRSRSAVAVMKNVVTSESGEYSFDNVKEGVYTIYASSDDSTEKAVLTNVVVQANQIVTATDLNLTATGSICGRVTLDGKEDENLGITVVIAGTSYMAVTDSFGFFIISDIPADKGYQVVIMKGDYCTIWSKVSVEAGKENNLGEKNITSQKNPTVSPNTDSSFIWQGSSATSPENPEKYWAYFNTTDGCSYIYDGEKWTLLAQAGADGKDGADGNGGGASVEHKITYELNGGTNNTKNPNSFLEYLTVNLSIPTRDGYYFTGWYENADFSGNIITGWKIGEKRTDVTLYAKWETFDTEAFDTTPVFSQEDSFPYGFKFTTEEGWAAQFICANATTEKVFEKTFVNVGGSANMKTEGTNEAVEYSEDSTKLFIDSGELVLAKMYTLTYEKKTGKVSLAAAADGAKATSTAAQEADADGDFPAGIYISGYLGSNWAGNGNAAGALLMDVVDAANEVYAFTWAAPTTVTVTLKITMADTNSTLYLRDVPVKTDGTSEINGSIYGWNDGTAVVIKNEDNSAITGGIFDATATATANAEWALINYVNGNTDVNLAEKFGMTGADDVLQLSIDGEKWVPYVKGQVTTFSWKNAQNKMRAPAAAE